MSTLAVIPYFNFYPKPKRLAILEDSINGLAGECDVWVVRCGYPLGFNLDVPSTTLDSPAMLKCFQKEALINHAIYRLIRQQHPKYLKREYSRVLFIDGDIQPRDGSSWSELLERCSSFSPNQFGQPCSHFETPQGILESSSRRILTNQNQPLNYSLVQGTAPGGCWVVGWDVLVDYFQYPFCLLGGGDSVFISSFLTDLNSDAFFANSLVTPLRDAIYGYIQNARSRRIGYFATPEKNLCLKSVDHGQAKTKKYVERHSLYNFPATIRGVGNKVGELVKVVKSDDGLMVSSFISGYMSNL